MRAVFASALALLALGAPVAASALTVQEAMLFATPAVALITAEVRAEVTLNCGSGTKTVRPSPFIETGTGWFVDGTGYLITNGHVVDPVYRLPAWVTHELKKKAIEQACVDPVLRAQGLARGARPDIEDTIRREAAGRAMASAQVTPQPLLSILLSSGQRLNAEVVKFSPPPGFDANGRPVADFGRDLALLRVRAGVYPAIGLSDVDAKIGDPVHIIGFPGVVLSHELLDKSATLEPSVTNGAVSGYKQDAIGQAMIQTDAAAAHGNSGGPAVGDDARLVGVMMATTMSASGGVVQGFNFLIPARDVRKFLEGTPVKSGQSRFNDAWRAGLNALFADRYSTAVARITEANALLPDLADVKRTLAEADRKMKNPPPRPFPWAWATLGVTLLSVGAYGGMFGRRWWKNRYRIQPAQVIAAIESGRNPQLVDVRTKTDFETSPLRLPGAVRLDPDDVLAGKPEAEPSAEREQLVVTYDTSPEEATAEKVANALRARGFKSVRILKGGLGGWTNARLPVESKSYLPSIGIEIYKNLTLGDLERRKFKAGEVIFKEGAEAKGEAFLVHAGTVHIKRTFDGVEKTLSTLGEGELFGDIALFREGPRSADAVAATDVELIVINNDRLDWLIRNRPQLTKEVVRRLSNWVVQTDRERALSNR
ncbi:MAG TPA: cyclic nucleotide-binding domain-containing protein [Methylomirabilota bacterium]|jgi:S1-C subfamily serine protease/rhodanese-related sulfurtransferase|nr:cyclic nucleotide-binding domain-containing protein [Methylomirabilota bacterium]